MNPNDFDATFFDRVVRSCFFGTTTMQIHNLTDLGWNNYFQSQLHLDSLDSQHPFRVTTVQRNLIECVGVDADNQPHSRQISTYHWRNATIEEHPTVGDWLLLDDSFQPLRILERKSLIKRRKAGKESLVQLMAANVDTAFIVTSCNADFSVNRIERYLSIAAESAIHCVAIFTKIDLCADAARYVDELSQSRPELPIEMVNATEPATVSILEKWIGNGQAAVLLGSSGVGKSTLINSLKGSAEQTTSAIRDSDSKGRHTTTSRSLHHLPGGGLLLDSPGLRELQMIDTHDGIRSTFSEIDTLSKQCRFKDCQHATEPGCAVIRAIKTGELDQRLLDNYQKLLTEQARNNESLAERRHNDRALGRFYKQTLNNAKKFKSRE